MKAQAKQQKSAASPTPLQVVACNPAPGDCSRQEDIAMAAYYKALARGFAPGMEIDDWLEAESEYDAAQRNEQ